MGQAGQKYNLILMDAPWQYAQRAAWSETRFGGGVSAQYPTLTDQDLFRLREAIDPIVEKDCLLLLWAVWPKMDVAIDLIRAWNFKFSTRAFTWFKTYPRSGKLFQGPGAGTASCEEVIIAAYRGKFPAPALKLQSGIVESVFGVDDDPCVTLPHPRYPKDYFDKDKRSKIIHSAKPEEFSERIERLWPDYKKLELFARRVRPGWDCVGRDLSGLDIFEELALIRDGVWNQSHPYRLHELSAGNRFAATACSALLKKISAGQSSNKHFHLRVLETI